MKGIVYLVGAGPGDPGLITVRGARLLTRADVVIYDHLVSTRLLEHCQPGATIVYAGKEQGRHTSSQAAINRLLVRHARAGKTVVRLKGGDPIIFGRAGEEALALAKSGIACEIVPGVTSAIAAPAYAGIPVTHRQFASSVALVTGHEDPSKPERAVDWRRVAMATDTLICLMGVRTLPRIAAELIRHGRARATPCAVIEWGTLPAQRTIEGTLGTIAQRCARARLKAPAVIVVGEVVRCRAELAWFERKPLVGRRILVTRPTTRADELADRLEEFGAEIVRLPAIELAAVALNGTFHRAIDELNRTDWVLFTSPEGMAWFERMLRPLHKDLRVLHGRHIGAIGPKTAASIEQRGIHVDFVPTAYNQEGLVSGLRRNRALHGKRALIFSAKESRDVLEEGLRAAGMAVSRVPIYRTVAPAALSAGMREALRRPLDLVTVTSASCVESIVAALRAARRSRVLRQLRFASIGPVTSQAVRQAGGRLAIEAKTATIEGLVEAIASWGVRQRKGARRALSRISAAPASSA